MRICYFGELIEENGQKVEYTKKVEKPVTCPDYSAAVENVRQCGQMAMAFSSPEEQPGRSYMQSVGEILQEINMNLDVYRSELTVN